MDKRPTTRLRRALVAGALAAASLLSPALLASSAGGSNPSEASPTSATPPAPPADRILQFGGDRLFPPFEWLDENGEPQGFQVELVRAIASKINMSVEIRLASWSDIRDEFNDGTIEVVGMFDGTPRRQSAVFGDPHTVAASEIFVRRGEGDYHELADLKGKRVIVQAAGLAADRFRADNAGVELIPVATESEALLLLASGTGDAAVVTQLGGRGAMKRLGLTNITTTGPPVLESRYALCVRAGNEDLLEKLNQGLAILKRTGEYNALYEKWFGDVDRPAVSIRHLVLYGAIGVGTVAVYVLSSLIWTRLLKRRVDERTRQLQAELGERARVQGELERSERRFRELIEHAPEAILVIDPRRKEGGGGGGEPRVTAANPKAENLFGLTRERLLEADPRRLVDVDWGTYDGVGSSTPREVRIRRSDGGDVDCELRVAPLPDTGATLLRASLVDVSERRRAERRQRVLIDELDHRVKNTLASVIGLSEGLIRSSGSLDEFRDAFVPRVHAMARAHEALAAAKWEGVRVSQSLKLVLRSVPEARARRVILSGDDPLVSPEQSMAVCLVLHELAVNSIVHGALSRPDSRVDLRCESAGNRVRLFWSEPADPGADGAGSIDEGFGLALVRGLIEHQLRGRVRFERRSGAYLCEVEFDADQTAQNPSNPGAAAPSMTPQRGVHAAGDSPS